MCRSFVRGNVQVDRCVAIIKYLNIVDDQLIEASDHYYAKHSALYDVEKSGGTGTKNL